MHRPVFSRPILAASMNSASQIRQVTGMVSHRDINSGLPPDNAQPSPSGFERRKEHKPEQASPKEDVYVLTLRTNAEHEAQMTALRERYFPAHLLKVPQAHITLFHALPESLLSTIISDLTSRTALVSSFPIHTEKPYGSKRGVFIPVTGLEKAKSLRQALQSRWWKWLSPQDQSLFGHGQGRGKGKGHYTIMNKVDDEDVVKSCLDELEADFTISKGFAVGLALWRYDRGWWRHEQDFRFSE
ncbi:hypothetical protein F5Y16DRAFT_361230 [Xylariaceae sp. FL0255]|nr:hypothetical protein F5Y16DRAFT_361230 [Xylariaceae sp. FL0255]